MPSLPAALPVGYDLGDGRRRWRALDFGTTFAYLEADAPRVSCKRHGVIVAAVPWARHDSVFTRSFEDQVAWLTVQASKTAVSQLMQVAWRSVGWICTRVAEEQAQVRDLFAGLKRIEVDEISIRKGQRYLTVVMDHDTGRLVWAGPGRDRKTVEKFLDLLGKERCYQLRLISCDMASWITGPVGERCPNANVCYDPFHLIKLSTDALDEIRHEVWNDARRQGQTQLARELKGARFAPCKNPADRAPAAQARPRSATQPAALPRLPPLPTTPRDLPSTARGSDRAARRLAQMGPSQPTRTVRQARAHHHRTAFRDRSRDPQPAAQRPGRAGEHPATAHHPPRVRVPLPSRRDRARDARSRRALPSTTRSVTQPTVHAGGALYGSRSARGRFGRQAQI